MKKVSISHFPAHHAVGERAFFNLKLSIHPPRLTCDFFWENFSHRSIKEIRKEKKVKDDDDDLNFLLW